MEEEKLEYEQCYHCYYKNNAIARARFTREVSEFEGNKITPCRSCDGVLFYESEDCGTPEEYIDIGGYYYE